MSFRLPHASLLAFTLGLGAGPAAAQRLPSHVLPADHAVGQLRLQQPPRSAGSPTSGPVLGAILGGALGAALGGLAGYELGGGNRTCGDDPCGFTGGLVGLALGGSLGIGVGAHLGNGRHGDAAKTIGVSVGTALVLGGLAAALQLPAEAALVVPVAQIAGAVWAELMTTPRREP